MANRNPYTWSGLGLLVAGVLISVVAYFIFQSMWLTALGLCMLILSFILVALGKAIPRLPPEVCYLLMETGVDNISSLLEELGIKSQAIYLPPAPPRSYPVALIPLHADGLKPKITRTLPRRLIARYGDTPEDIGILLSTIGSSAARMLESKPGPTAGELEAALTSLFTGKLGIAEGASVTCTEDSIKVGIKNPHTESGVSQSYQCLGSPLASIVASVAAEAWGRPMTVKEEGKLKDEFHIELEIDR